jgi:hypothetical protein
MDIISEIETKFVPGTKIPKPISEFDYFIKGWGIRRGERALIYKIPNQKNPIKPHKKGITVSEFQIAYERITNGEDLNRKWFEETLYGCNKEGTCNFTTLGGIFQELGLVKYYQEGVYKNMQP